MDLFTEKRVEPMLVSANQAPFDDPDWIYELKMDGTRCIAYLDETGTVLRNKRHKDLSVNFPELSQVHKQVKGRCILDGEVFVLNHGKSDFYELQRRSLMTNAFKISLAVEKLPATFLVFDILYQDGEQLTHLPLMERKERLQRCVTESERMAFSRYIEGKGIALYEAAKASGQEGIVAKKRDSLYLMGKRSKDWVKCKNLLDDDFVVCGHYVKTDGFTSIILGQYQDGKLLYQGHVVLGMTKADYAQIKAAESTDKAHYCDSFPDFEEGPTWVVPQLVCRVEYMDRTNQGGLRQPVFRGLRDDKAAQDCVYVG